MDKPEVEFFTEDVDGVEYLNVGFKFSVPNDDEPIRCVLGAFSVSPEDDGLVIIKSLVEEAAQYMQGIYSGVLSRIDDSPIEVVKNELIIP